MKTRRRNYSSLFILSLLYSCSGGGSENSTPASNAANPPTSFLQIYPIEGAQGAAVETYFRWEDAAEEEDYVLEIALDAAFSSKVFTSASLPADSTQTTLPAGMLEPKHSYFWRVSAHNAAGATIASNGPFSMQTGDPSAPLGMKWNYDGSKMEADPSYVETIGHFFYPLGKGPVTLGYAPEKLVVVLFLRGENENTLTLDSPVEPPIFLKDYVLPHGWFGGYPNYPIFDTAIGEKYTKATDGLALLLQFLRANAEWMNLDPDKIVNYGTSFGGIHSYALAFKEDQQELASPDPAKQQSSRPNFLIAKSSVSALDCMDPSLASKLKETFLPEHWPHASFAEEAAEQSAYWWLLHPEVYGREKTAPMCLVYHIQEQGHCGKIMNPHHGIFGVIMYDALALYTASAEPDLLSKSKLLDSTFLSEAEIYEQITLWIEARLSD